MTLPHSLLNVFLAAALVTALVCDRRSDAGENAASPPSPSGRAADASPSVPARPTPAREAARATFQAALDAFGRDRDIQAARAGFAEAAREDPTFAQPRFNLALLDAADNQWDQAIQLFQEVQQLEKTSPLGARAGQELRHVRDLRTLWATPEGRKKVEYDRALARARALLVAGATDDATAEASAAIRLDATRYEAHCAAADALNRLGKYAAAAAHVREAMRLAPANLQPKLQQALAEVQASEASAGEVRAADQALADNEYGAAGDHYLAAWKLQPAREATALRGAMMLALAERLDEAKAVLEKLVASTDPRVVREAAEQLKTVQTFQRQQAITREAEASAAHLRQQAGLPAEPERANAGNTPSQASAATSKTARPPGESKPPKPADPVADLIEGIGSPSSTAAGRNPERKPTTAPAEKHDDVTDLINSAK